MKRQRIACVALTAALLTVSACSTPPDQQAIAAIRQAGGKVTADDEGRIVSVDLSNTAASDDVLAMVGALPHVHTIHCTNAQRINGSGLPGLAGLTNLETLYLVGTSLDDAGLQHVRHLKSLRTLHLGSTKITDAGIAAVDDLTHLRTLMLGGTAITDRGLVQLRDLRELSTLNLKGTKTTPAGIQELRRILPNTRIDR